MRYSMLVHLTKMVRTLQEAAAYIDNAPDGDSLCTELLSNGVEMLEQIRMTVDKHRGDLYDPILLEHLAAAEALWEVGGDTLQGALEAFALALPKSVRYQVRAVFFTGLGSTWDAMESVYTYMRDDPRFDPVVVLIPVFRQVQQDGQVKQEVTYVDYLTQMGIPFLEYTQYSLEKDSPDVAFTNQPYESVVLPDYWPENIAKHTRLVYLPYCLPDLVTESTPMSLAQLPAFRFAWKVVCATERQVKFYCRHAANKGANALLTGLPKTDPLVTTNWQEVPWPDGWQCLRGKTVFLWNSWYDAEVSSLRLFHNLLEWFIEHKDCGLIWRPHPMTDTVTKLYYPDKYPIYQKNLQQARAADNVVVDTQASFVAAFSVSNALISDYSSMLPQYLLIDKPAAWIKSHAFHFTGEEFIESRWMERMESVEDVYAFMDRIRNGEDRKAALRSAIRHRDLSLADGHCGERVCEAVWCKMHNDDLIPLEEANFIV